MTWNAVNCNENSVRLAAATGHSALKSQVLPTGPDPVTQAPLSYQHLTAAAPNKEMEFKLIIGFFALIGCCLAQKCNKADVVFLLDESASIQPIPFSQIKQFVFDVMDGLGVEEGGDKSRAAIIMFSDAAQFLFRFNIINTRSLNVTKDILRKHVQVGGSTQTYIGLDLIRRAAFTTSYGARLTNDVANICIVITDGNSQLENRTKEAAERLRKESKVHVFAIGVGNETLIRQRELENIASDKNSIYRVQDAAGLNDIKASVTGKACNVVVEEEEEEDYYVPTEGPPEDYEEGEETSIVES